MKIDEVYDVINRGLGEVLLESDRQTGKTTAILYAIKKLPDKNILLVVSTHHQLGFVKNELCNCRNVIIVTAKSVRDRDLCLVGISYDVIIVDDYWFSANFINEDKFYQFFDSIAYIRSYNKDTQYIKVT